MTMERNVTINKCTNHNCVVFFATNSQYVGSIFFAMDGIELFYNNSFLKERGKFEYRVAKYSKINSLPSEDFYLYDDYDYGEEYDVLCSAILEEDLNITPDNFQAVVDRLLLLRAFG